LLRKNSSVGVLEYVFARYGQGELM